MMMMLLLLLLLPLPFLMVIVINVRQQHQERYPFSLVAHIRSVWLSFSALFAGEDSPTGGFCCSHSHTSIT